MCQWEWVCVIVDAFQRGHNCHSRSVVEATMQPIRRRNTQLIWCQITKRQRGCRQLTPYVWKQLNFSLNDPFCWKHHVKYELWMLQLSRSQKVFFFSVVGVSTASETEVGRDDVKTPWRCWFIKLKIWLPLLQDLYWNRSSRQWLQSLEKRKWLFWWSWPCKPQMSKARGGLSGYQIIRGTS